MSFPARSGSTVAEIDLGALARNLAAVRKLSGARPGILAAVKADAYGHGAVEVSRVLEREGVTMLGVARIEEGIELREAGLEAPILVLSGVPVGGPPPFESLEDRVYELLKFRLTPVLYDLRTILAIDRLLQRRELERQPGDLSSVASMDYHLKVDTGMGRVGIPVEALRDGLAVIGSLKHLRLRGALTHFASAEGASEDDAAFTKRQLESFTSAMGPLQTIADGTLLLHASGSAATIEGIATQLDLVRPGIALYGAYPHERHRAKVALEPVMRLTTRVLFVKDLPAGSPISYGRTFVTTRPSRIATLPVGYADGYLRALSSKGEVVVRGSKAPVVGRVCMDLTMIDVTDVRDVVPGDEVVLIGAQGETRVTAEQLAEKAGTISYEIFTSVSKRVPRVYKGR